MVVQDPVRLSEALFAWANSINESLGKFAYGSLRSSLERSTTSKVGNGLLSVRLSELALNRFWAAYKVVRLSEGYVHLSEASSGSWKTHELSNPISSKNPILIPQSPKMDYYDVYRFYIQHNIKDNSEKHNQQLKSTTFGNSYNFQNLNQKQPFQSNFRNHVYILLIELLAHPYLIRWTRQATNKFKLSPSNSLLFLVSPFFSQKLMFSFYCT